MAYKCLLLCGLFFFKGFCKSLFQIGFDFSQVVSRSLHCEAENLLLFRVSLGLFLSVFFHEFFIISVARLKDL